MGVFKIEKSRNNWKITLFGKEYHVRNICNYYKNKDYGLLSGERQVAKHIEDIRKDHLNRYYLVASSIKKLCDLKRELQIADIFCGTGYGSYIISKEIPSARLLSIDGSKAAIKLAKKYYQTGRINFLQKFFPFDLEKDYFDVIISLESIEHISDDKEFFENFVSGLKNGGLLFISTPNAQKYIREVNNDGWHIRHYINNSFENWAKKMNLDLVDWYGQDCYIFDSIGQIAGYIPENEMTLKEKTEGQFQVFVFRKNA